MERTEAPDLQAAAPEVALGLSSVGVTGVQKAVRVGHGRSEKLIAATIDCTVDLDEALGSNPSTVAQRLDRATAADRLPETRFDAADVERILELAQRASHNPHGRATLLVRTSERLNAERLVQIVESSMSSPIY